MAGIHVHHKYKDRFTRILHETLRMVELEAAAGWSEPLAQKRTDAFDHNGRETLTTTSSTRPRRRPRRLTVEHATSFTPGNADFGVQYTLSERTVLGALASLSTPDSPLHAFQHSFWSLTPSCRRSFFHVHTIQRPALYLIY